MCSMEHFLLKPNPFTGSQKVGIWILTDLCNAFNDAAAGDGVFSVENDGDISLVDLKTNTTTVLVKRSAVKDVCSFQSILSTKFKSLITGTWSPTAME